jgi:hypothetical protein
MIVVARGRFDMIQLTRREGIFASSALAACPTAGCAQRPKPTATRLLSAAIVAAVGEDFGSALLRAKALGITSLPLPIFWDEIERQPGVYTAKENWLASVNRSFPFLGMDVQLALSVIDTNNDRRPAWLRDKPFDSVACLQAFDNFLTWVMAQIPKLAITSIAIGNEVDVLLGNDAARWRAFDAFLQIALLRVRSLRPNTRVGTKMTWAGLTTTSLEAVPRRMIEQIVQRSDHIAATYYPISEGFAMKPVDVVRHDLSALVRRWHGKPIELSEIGYSSRQGCGGSPENQARFIQVLFDTWDEHHDAFHTVSIFSWTDFSPSVVETLAGYYRLDNAAFKDFLGGLGLREHNGRAKPAMTALRDGARARGFLPS